MSAAAGRWGNSSSSSFSSSSDGSSAGPYDDEKKLLGIKNRAVTQRRRPSRKSGKLFASFLSGLTKVQKPTVGVNLQAKDLSFLSGAPSCRPVNNPLLPPQLDDVRGRKTLVLDLDETLIHSYTDASKRHDYDFTIKLQTASGPTTFYVALRPYAADLLEEMARLYEVVIFSGSSFEYVDAVMRQLDPKKLVSQVLYREDCTIFGEFCVKDLSILGRDLRHTVIVDNSDVSYGLQPENALAVGTWICNLRDVQLLKTMAVLKRVANVDDVRGAKYHF